MESQRAIFIFKAVQKDDLKEFKNHVFSNADLNLCFGRFPLLSLSYLYNSHRILSEFENTMLKVKNFDVVDEPFEIYLKYKLLAKKSMRFFVDGEIIYPILMLAILDNRIKIAKDYEKLFKNDEILQKLQKIYSINNDTTIKANKDSFSAPPKKLKGEQKFLFSLISIFLCFMMIFPVFSLIIASTVSGIGTKNNPLKISTASGFKRAIKENVNYISLEDNLYITIENVDYVSNFSGVIEGNNQTIFISKIENSLVDELAGEIKNVNLKILVNNFEITENFSFFANKMTGSISNCSISGNANVKFSSEEESYFSLFVIDNEGVIENCSVDFNISAINSTGKNAYLSSFASNNTGKILNCETKESNFETDTVDISGFVVNNSGTISNSINRINIKQTSDQCWHPNSAGIVGTNYGEISYVENYGNIETISTNEDTFESELETLVIYSSGITNWNFGKIQYSKNYGDVSGNGKNAMVLVSGIVSRNHFDGIETVKETAGFFEYDKIVVNYTGEISNCENSGNLTLFSLASNLENNYCSVGGITSINAAKISNCSSSGDITVNSTSMEIRSGGIVGSHLYYNYSQYVESKIENSSSSSDIVVFTLGNNVELGGIVGFSRQTTISKCEFTGNLTATSKKLSIGGIAGYCENSTILYSGFIGNETFNSEIVYSGGIGGYLSSCAVGYCYSGAVILDSTPIDEESENLENEEQDENTEQESTENETNSNDRFIAKIIGFLYTSNPNSSLDGNKCINNNEYTIINLIVKSYDGNYLYKIEEGQLGTIVYENLEELLNSLESEEN